MPSADDSDNTLLIGLIMGIGGVIAIGGRFFSVLINVYSHRILNLELFRFECSTRWMFSLRNSTH